MAASTSVIHGQIGFIKSKIRKIPIQKAKFFSAVIQYPLNKEWNMKKHVPKLKCKLRTMLECSIACSTKRFDNVQTRKNDSLIMYVFLLFYSSLLCLSNAFTKIQKHQDQGFHSKFSSLSFSSYSQYSSYSSSSSESKDIFFFFLDISDIFLLGFGTTSYSCYLGGLFDCEYTSSIVNCLWTGLVVRYWSGAQLIFFFSRDIRSSGSGYCFLVGLVYFFVYFLFITLFFSFI